MQKGPSPLVGSTFCIASGASKPSTYLMWSTWSSTITSLSESGDLLTLYLQHLLDYTRLEAGFVFLPFTVLFTIGNLQAGRSASAIGPGLPMAGGMALIAAASLLLAFVAPTSGLAIVVVALVITPGFVRRAWSHIIHCMTTIEWESAGEFEDIRYEKAEGIAKITINRPEVRNAFRPLTVMEMQRAIE